MDREAFRKAYPAIKQWHAAVLHQTDAIWTLARLVYGDPASGNKQLVDAPLEEQERCTDAAKRIADYLEGQTHAL